VFENRVLRRIRGLKRDGIIEGWRKLHIEELHELHSSPNIIRMIKPMRMRWTGHAARMGRRGICTYKIWGGKVRRKETNNMDLKRDRMEWCGVDSSGSG
jgi:hypothetical protein